MSRRANLLLLLAVPLLAAGCTQSRAIGKWNGAGKTPYQKVSTSLEFKPDGTLIQATNTPAGTVSATGTYKMNGDTVNLHVSKVTTTFPSGGSIIGQMSQDRVATVNVQGDTLSLTQNGHTAQYTRSKE
jgi:hypothetical protein